MITDWEILGIVAGVVIAWFILLALFVWAVARFTRHVRGLHQISKGWTPQEVKDLGLDERD